MGTPSESNKGKHFVHTEHGMTFSVRVSLRSEKAQTTAVAFTHVLLCCDVFLKAAHYTLKNNTAVRCSVSAACSR